LLSKATYKGENSQATSNRTWCNNKYYFTILISIFTEIEKNCRNVTAVSASCMAVYEIYVRHACAVVCLSGVCVFCRGVFRRDILGFVARVEYMYDVLFCFI